jgi:predicted RNase H-like HicB family nuclease
MPPYHVVAEWDSEAGLWVASSEDVPGLATGAATFEMLLERLNVLVPELLMENEILPAGAASTPFEVKVRAIEPGR